MNTTQSPRIASLLTALGPATLCSTLSVTLLLTAGCDINLPDLETDVNAGTDGEGEDGGEDEDEDDGTGIDVLDEGGEDGQGGADGPGDGADGESGDGYGEDGYGEDGYGEDGDGSDGDGEDGYGSDGYAEDGFGDDGPLPPVTAACAEYCAVELECDQVYPTAEECLLDCQAASQEAGECLPQSDALFACLGALDCAGFGAYWQALEALGEGEDPGAFPCAEELFDAVQCFEGQQG